MLGFTIALAGFVATLFLMVPLLNFLPLIALGLVAVGFAMWALSEYTNSLDLTGIEALGTFFGSLASLMSTTQENIQDVAEGISKIVAEVNKLDTEKAIQLSTAMDSVTAITKVVATGSETASGVGARNATGQPITIVLKLKNKVLAKETGKIVNGMFSSDTDLSFAT
jgi:phosphosulfolactate synthase (CoM biosynthesis protein A)